MSVSIFASAVRTPLWDSYMRSLESTTVPYEVIFSGPRNPENKYENFKFIKTGDIKPCQNYAIASRACTMETISWSCDDAEAIGDIYGHAYRYWKSQNNDKLILSLQTNESGQWQDMKQHSFFGGDAGSPLMAPICLMSRKFFNDLGGIDQKFVCGQYENDIVMRAYANGATVEIFGNKDMYIDINHVEKSVMSGEIKDKQDFVNRPFAQGYGVDRMVLEKMWARPNYARLLVAMKEAKEKGGVVLNKDFMEMQENPQEPFMPYPEEIPLDKSLNNKGWWL